MKLVLCVVLLTVAFVAIGQTQIVQLVGLTPQSLVDHCGKPVSITENIYDRNGAIVHDPVYQYSTPSWRVSIEFNDNHSVRSAWADDPAGRIRGMRITDNNELMTFMPCLKPEEKPQLPKVSPEAITSQIINEYCGKPTSVSKTPQGEVWTYSYPPTKSNDGKDVVIEVNGGKIGGLELVGNCWAGDGPDCPPSHKGNRRPIQIASLPEAMPCLK